eukprot:TRINITY_DN68550_c0_g1_i1.p1 TRINITY_DN68550_c0_g1~~TRINITY_DN68550_c0_g1_i1.p1  ORF type:complete len:807 (-),score=42.27 TRINITY_DN68550_c0_g1_i1:569-2989(-)
MKTQTDKPQRRSSSRSAAPNPPPDILNVTIKPSELERYITAVLCPPSFEADRIAKQQQQQRNTWQTVLGVGRRNDRATAFARSGFPLHETAIIAVCAAFRDLLMQGPGCVHVEAPCHIAGDIHGQYRDLLRIFDTVGLPDGTTPAARVAAAMANLPSPAPSLPPSQWVFLGDYVDRGAASIETMILLMLLKLRFPNRLHLLRGNHEAAAVCRVYGFFDECKRRFSVKVWKAFVASFNALPFAAVVGDRIFCAHGGLSPHLTDVAQIDGLPRPAEVPESGLACDLVWADPDGALQSEAVPNPERGISVKFGPPLIERFLAHHRFDLVVRAHECVEEGYNFLPGRKLVTIFSAPNYCGLYNNAAAVLSVAANLRCSFKIFPPEGSGNPTVAPASAGPVAVRPGMDGTQTAYPGRYDGRLDEGTDDPSAGGAQAGTGMNPHARPERPRDSPAASPCSSAGAWHASPAVPHPAPSGGGLPAGAGVAPNVPAAGNGAALSPLVSAGAAPVASTARRQPGMSGGPRREKGSGQTGGAGAFAGAPSLQAHRSGPSSAPTTPEFPAASETPSAVMSGDRTAVRRGVPLASPVLPHRPTDATPRLAGVGGGTDVTARQVGAAGGKVSVGGSGGISGHTAASGMRGGRGGQRQSGGGSPVVPHATRTYQDGRYVPPPREDGAGPRSSHGARHGPVHQRNSAAESSDFVSSAIVDAQAGDHRRSASAPRYSPGVGHNVAERWGVGSRAHPEGSRGEVPGGAPSASASHDLPANGGRWGRPSAPMVPPHLQHPLPATRPPPSARPRGGAFTGPTVDVP